MSRVTTSPTGRRINFVSRNLFDKTALHMRVWLFSAYRWVHYCAASLHRGGAAFNPFPHVSNNHAPRCPSMKTNSRSKKNPAPHVRTMPFWCRIAKSCCGGCPHFFMRPSRMLQRVPRTGAPVPNSPLSVHLLPTSRPQLFPQCRQLLRVPSVP